MEIIRNVTFLMNAILLGFNGALLWRVRRLLNQLKRDVRLVEAYVKFYEELSRSCGHNVPLPTPEELEGEKV